MNIVRSILNPKHATATITFAGAAGSGAAGTAVPVFTTTGRVLVLYIVAFCTTSIAAGVTATISLGTAGDVDAFIAVTTATDIDADDWWLASVPAPDSYQLAINHTAGYTVGQTDKAVSGNIIINPLLDTTSSGVLVIDAFYLPITGNGALS